MLVVAAAGNEGYQLSLNATYPAVYSRAMPFVLTVGASDESNDWASFSNWDENAGELAMC